jgi:hypothetical protein
MTLFEQLVEALPELADLEAIKSGAIVLQDDSDGTGAYIAKWDYSKPVPKKLESYVR